MPSGGITPDLNHTMLVSGGIRPAAPSTSGAIMPAAPSIAHRALITWCAFFKVRIDLRQRRRRRKHGRGHDDQERVKLGAWRTSAYASQLGVMNPTPCGK